MQSARVLSAIRPRILGRNDPAGSARLLAKTQNIWLAINALFF
jgi:hypothetical protein